MLNNLELRGNTDSERCFLLNLIQCYTVYQVMSSMQHGPQKIVLLHQFGPPSIRFSSISLLTYQIFLNQMRKTTKNPPSKWPPSQQTRKRASHLNFMATFLWCARWGTSSSAYWQLSSPNVMRNYLFNGMSI